MRCLNPRAPCSDFAVATRKRLEEAARKKEAEEREKAAQRYQRRDHKVGRLTGGAGRRLVGLWEEEARSGQRSRQRGLGSCCMMTDLRLIDCPSAACPRCRGGEAAQAGRDDGRGDAARGGAHSAAAPAGREGGCRGCVRVACIAACIAQGGLQHLPLHACRVWCLLAWHLQFLMPTCLRVRPSRSRTSAGMPHHCSGGAGGAAPHRHSQVPAGGSRGVQESACLHAPPPSAATVQRQSCCACGCVYLH